MKDIHELRNAKKTNKNYDIIGPKALRGGLRKIIKKIPSEESLYPSFGIKELKIGSVEKGKT